VKNKTFGFVHILMIIRTNAIHIGDRILAINDVSLRGKGLNEAIKLLQGSTDEITLKISRTINAHQSISKKKKERMFFS
jgi:C-terminal processing protease CtpA/Prc